MDPDANLEEQNRLIARSNKNGYLSEVDALRLDELKEALKEWLDKGGFPPKAWKRP